MLFSLLESPSEIWQAIKHELHRGALDPKHPFRFVNLGTTAHGFPKIRTVVLREITNEFDFLVFTDHRTAKVKEIQESPYVALHVYHPKKMVQLRVEAKAEIHFQNEVSEKYWEKIPQSRRFEYTGVLPPGECIQNPEEGREQGESIFFTVIQIKPFLIEALQLDKKGHLRIQFQRNENWQGQWLVP